MTYARSSSISTTTTSRTFWCPADRFSPGDHSMLPLQRLILLALAAFALVEASYADPPATMRAGMNINGVNMYQVGAPHNDALTAAGPGAAPAWNVAGPDGQTGLYAAHGTPPPVGYHTNAAT